MTREKETKCRVQYFHENIIQLHSVEAETSISILTNSVVFSLLIFFVSSSAWGFSSFCLRRENLASRLRFVGMESHQVSFFSSSTQSDGTSFCWVWQYLLRCVRELSEAESELLFCSHKHTNLCCRLRTDSLSCFVNVREHYSSPQIDSSQDNREYHWTILPCFIGSNINLFYCRKKKLSVLHLGYWFFPSLSLFLQLIRNCFSSQRNQEKHTRTKKNVRGKMLHCRKISIGAGAIGGSRGCALWTMWKAGRGTLVVCCYFNSLSVHFLPRKHFY